MTKRNVESTATEEEKAQILIRPVKSLRDKLRALADKKMGGGSSLSAYCVHVLHEHVEKMEAEQETTERLRRGPERPRSRR